MWTTLPAAGRLSPLRRMIHQAYGPYRLSGNANGGIVTIEQTGGSDDADLPAERRILCLGTWGGVWT